MAKGTTRPRVQRCTAFGFGVRIIRSVEGNIMAKSVDAQPSNCRDVALLVVCILIGALVDAKRGLQ
jgi:hypothetical protein